MPKRKTNTKKMWLSSTIIVLIFAFLLSVGLGIWRYGWEMVLDEMLKYCIGATGTALFIGIIGFIFRKQLGKLMKQMMG